MSCCKGKDPKIGDLRFSIKIYDKTLVPSNCNVTFNLTPKHTIKAKIEVPNRTDRKIFEDTNDGVQVTDIFYIRHKSDIEADDLIEFDNKYFIIQGYLDIDKKKKWLKIFATERGTTTNSRNKL